MSSCFILLLLFTGVSNLIWRRADNLNNDGSEAKSDVVFDSFCIASLSREYNLCVTGPGLQDVQSQQTRYGASCAWFSHVNIFARVSPAQKESILRALNDSGAITLMCGDGTNDVGALKMAHVGVSIVNDPEFESRVEANKAVKGNSKDRMSRALAELQEQENDPTIVKLGDASIASPFTSRRTSIDAVITVVRQGRATLVTTVEVHTLCLLHFTYFHFILFHFIVLLHFTFITKCRHNFICILGVQDLGVELSRFGLHDERVVSAGAEARRHADDRQRTHIDGSLLLPVTSEAATKDLRPSPLH